MKLIDIVETLVSEGHKVSFRMRTDGGLIITSIDGKKFKSLTEGNRTARSMVVGGELSFARAEQVHFNVKKYIKLEEGQKKATGSIDEKMIKQLRKVQRMWRNRESLINQGRISKKKLRWYIQTQGKQKAYQYLLGRERYAQGYANDDNIDYLIQRIDRLHLVDKKDEFTKQIEDLKNYIEANRSTFRDEWIEPISQAVYEAEKGVKNIPEIIREIYAIMMK